MASTAIPILSPAAAAATAPVRRPGVTEEGVGSASAEEDGLDLQRALRVSTQPRGEGPSSRTPLAGEPVWPRSSSAPAREAAPRSGVLPSRSVADTGGPREAQQEDTELATSPPVPAVVQVRAMVMCNRGEASVQQRVRGSDADAAVGSRVPSAPGGVPPPRGLERAASPQEEGECRGERRVASPAQDRLEQLRWVQDSARPRGEACPTGGGVCSPGEQWEAYLLEEEPLARPQVEWEEMRQRGGERMPCHRTDSRHTASASAFRVPPGHFPRCRERYLDKPGEPPSPRRIRVADVSGSCAGTRGRWMSSARQRKH